VSADLIFWYGFALKMVMTASVVVVTSVAVERSGPFVGALIGALPTAAGAAYTILALEHPPAFIAASAIGSVAINGAVAIFAAIYALLAQRHGLLVSLGGAGIVWFAIAAALRLVEWTPLASVALNVVIYAVTIPLSWRFRGSTGPVAFVRTRFDIPLRALTAALVVAVVTAASSSIGSFASGSCSFPDHSRQLDCNHASAHRRQGDGEHDGARSASADRLGARLSCRALPRGADRGVVGACGRARRLSGVERFALDAALAAAEAQTSYFGFANCALSA
jgi:hypothetical protein